jgi:hypothetical protein
MSRLRRLYPRTNDVAIICDGWGPSFFAACVVLLAAVANGEECYCDR